uniref:Uncharacterized protein n=1 Tax=Nelumbo nucifera TaxID=4432 RepID=A0A822XK15_NELNU|nr:TPA_asm: hypothetical protein HUJ06_022110 [Nelumbo nucifera]
MNTVKYGRCSPAYVLSSCLQNSSGPTILPCPCDLWNREERLMSRSQLLMGTAVHESGKPISGFGISRFMSHDHPTLYTIHTCATCKNKRQTVKGAETEDDDGDDTVSTISTAESSDGQQSLSHEAVAQVRGEKPDIEDVLDMLYEKRPLVFQNQLMKYFEAWPRLLTMEDRSVRLAVGEGIAIIFENLSSDYRDLDYNESILTTVSGNIVSQSTCDDVVDQMRDLSIEAGGKGTSKKELNSQRNFFNDILDFIEGGSGPNISLKLSNSDSLTVTTWAQSIQVNMFRSFLGGGFQTHMLNNPFLHDVFDFRPKASKKQVLSTKEERMLYSPNSVSNKARTQELNRRRSNAQVENYGYYNVDMDE